MNAVTLSVLEENDIDAIVAAFKEIGWNKPSSLYQHYLEEQSLNARCVLVAKENNRFCGYVTLKWTSDYSFFVECNIPEIVDLNVLPGDRKKGIGTMLIQSCETNAKDHGAKKIGLGVGLLADYGDAQRLYISLGFRPDGKGLHYQCKAINYGESIIADDDLVLYFIKQLSN